VRKQASLFFHGAPDIAGIDLDHYFEGEDL